MTDYQADDMLKGRIAANRQMIKQCENEIRQLESVLKHRGGTKMSKKYKAGDKVTIVLNESNANDLTCGYNAAVISEQIISHEPAPEPVVGFVNVYQKGISGHDTQELANKWYGEDRLSCLKITYDPVSNTATAEVV